MIEFKKTGSIWQSPHAVRDRLVRAVCEKLEDCYGKSRLGNPTDPIDDLVFIIVSNKTAPKVAMRVYEAIKDLFRTWEDVLKVPVEELRSILEPAGLANVKASQIRGLLEKIANDFGECNLHALYEIPEERQLEYLTSLPGVSGKVARCVMMYTLGARVLPVDAHVHRISKRLGWTARKRADQSHEELEALVPPEYRFSFHVDCILHGREICRPREPLCESCCINDYCEYYLSDRFMSDPEASENAR